MIPVMDRWTAEQFRHYSRSSGVHSFESRPSIGVWIFQDLSKTFIYAAGALMYLKKEQQFMFYKKIKERGCKNIIFNEYVVEVADKCRGLPSMAFGDSGLNLLHLVDDFILRELSGTKDCPITAHINMDIPLEKIMSF